MYIPPKEIILKDGRTALFRSPLSSDAAAALEHMRISAAETPYLLRYPEEITMTVEEEANYLVRFPSDPSGAMIMCFVDGALAGNCQIVRKNKLKNRHRASVSIALQKAFWGIGIGTAMFAEMIAIAESWGILQMELEAIEGNERAMALYRKMGFEIVSHVPDAIRMPDGTFCKEFLMIRPVR